MDRKVLIAGAHGVIGRAVAIRLASQPDAEVFALSGKAHGADLGPFKTPARDWAGTSPIRRFGAEQLRHKVIPGIA